MSEFNKHGGEGALEITVKTATVGDIAKITTADIGKLCTYNASNQVGIDATNTTPLGIAGKIIAVDLDTNFVSLQVGGLMEVDCGETVAFNANRTYLGTYNGLLYVHSAAIVTAGRAASIVEGGTTTEDATIQM